MNAIAVQKEALKARIALRRQHLEMQLQTCWKNGRRKRLPLLPPPKWIWALTPPVAVLLWKRKITLPGLVAQSLAAWRIYSEILPLIGISGRRWPGRAGTGKTRD